jgi:hypothetical protein
MKSKSGDCEGKMKLIKPPLTWEEKQIATELLKIADKSVHPKELSTLSNQQKEGVAILAKKEYVTLAGKWVIIWWDDLTSALNPEQNTYPECFECSISLKGRPCIFVDSLPYCFKCAKQYERDIIESAKYKYERELKLYQEKRSAFLKKHPNFDSEMPFLEWSDAIIGLIGWLVFPVIGTIVGVMSWQGIRKYLWNREHDRLHKEHESINPVPIQPKPVEIDLELDESRFTEPIAVTNYRRLILVRDNYTCQNCEEQNPEADLEVHHIQIRAKGGIDHPTNLVTLCLHCHDRERWFGHKRMYPTTT